MYRLLLLIFSLPFVSPAQDIVIKKDTTVNNLWIIAPGTIIRFETGGLIRGRGTLQGGIIQAALTQQIFDTTLTVRPAGTYGQDFSCMWFGAKSSNADNWWYIQKAINTCLDNAIRNCFLPKGRYNYSKSLQISYLYKGSYIGAPIHFYGESDMWDERTVLLFNANAGYALGIQVGKGTEISNLTLRGKFTSPTTTGKTYYDTPLASYGQDGLYGLVIDYDGSKNVSGSTAVRVHDMKVHGFTVLYSVSPNGVTYNAEILSFENIQCGDGRIGFQSGQAQEKANSITNITSWGKIHTLISIGQAGKFQAGNYSINIANVANACIRLFDIRQSGWYCTNISNIFAESIGTIGNLSTGDSKNTPPMSISNSTFHFAVKENAGVQTLLTSNSTAINFSNCMFRYYGGPDAMHMKGVATFSNYFFSGPIKNETAGSIFLKNGVPVAN